MAASLLTRIAHAANPHSMERHTWKDQDLEQAVVSHLVRMLNTRQGSSLTCPDYGLIEVSEMLHDFPDAIGMKPSLPRTTRSSATRTAIAWRNGRVATW